MSRSNSRAISSISPARFFSASRRRKLRTSCSSPPSSSSSAAALARWSICGFRRSPRSSGTWRCASTKSPSSSRTGSSLPASLAASKRARAYMRWATAISPFSVVSLQHAEVELADRLVDQAALVLVVQRTPRHLLGGEQAELGDLGPDRLERSPRLGFDLALCLLEPALAVGLGLVLDAPQLRLGLVPRDRANILRLTARLADQLAALLEQLLNRTEGVPLQDEQRDQEADDRPDHQARRDLDQRIGAEEHQTRTYARIEPSRP